MIARPSAFSARDDREQPAGLAVGQRRGRLVHDDDPGVDAQRLGDLHQLPLGDAQLLDRGLRVDREADAREHFATHRLDLALVDRAPPRERLSAQEEVLGDGQVRRLAEGLVDDADPERLRVARAAQLDFPPVEKIRPSSRG